VGAVRLWDDGGVAAVLGRGGAVLGGGCNGTAAVVEKRRTRCKMSGVAGNGDCGAVRCCGYCAWAKEETERKMRARGWSGRVLGMIKARCGSTWPGCSDRQLRAASLHPHGGHALLSVGH